jgi:hypothetical protein
MSSPRKNQGEVFNALAHRRSLVEQMKREHEESGVERHAMSVGGYLIRAEWSAEHGELEITVEGVSASPNVHVAKNRTRLRFDAAAGERGR